MKDSCIAASDKIKSWMLQKFVENSRKVVKNGLDDCYNNMETKKTGNKTGKIGQEFIKKLKIRSEIGLFWLCYQLLSVFSGHVKVAQIYLLFIIGNKWVKKS